MSARFDKFMIHVDIGTDEKLAGLTDSERLCHIAGVLAIAAKSPMRGCLIVGDVEATAQHVALRASVTPKVAKSTLAKLVDVGVLVRDNDLGCFRIHNWERFNPAPKHDTSNAERQARWRARNASRNAPSNALRNGPQPLRNGGEVEGEVEEEQQKRKSPAVPTAVVAKPKLAAVEERQDSRLVDDVVGILQRGIDSLQGDVTCKTPTASAVREALAQNPVSFDTAVAVAMDVRAIVQSQNRAPNIAALYGQKLAKASIGMVA